MLRFIDYFGFLFFVFEEDFCDTRVFFFVSDIFFWFEEKVELGWKWRNEGMKKDRLKKQEAFDFEWGYFCLREKQITVWPVGEWNLGVFSARRVIFLLLGEYDCTFLFCFVFDGSLSRDLFRATLEFIGFLEHLKWFLYLQKSLSFLPRSCQISQPLMSFAFRVEFY